MHEYMSTYTYVHMHECIACVSSSISSCRYARQISRFMAHRLSRKRLQICRVIHRLPAYFPQRF